MNARGIADLLIERAAQADLDVPEPVRSQLVAYYEVLGHWNRTINLTALSNPSEAVDRLLLEPLAAASEVPHHEALIDLGSGGGSPAIPLAVGTRARRLVMVESRARKAAFLREALRELGIAGSVENSRFADLAVRHEFGEAFGLLSVRAIRVDEAVFAASVSLLRLDGIVALFGTMEAAGPPPGLPPTLRWLSSRRLLPTTRSALTRLQKVERST